MAAQKLGLHVATDPAAFLDVSRTTGAAISLFGEAPAPKCR